MSSSDHDTLHDASTSRQGSQAESNAGGNSDEETHGPSEMPPEGAYRPSDFKKFNWRNPQDSGDSSKFHWEDEQILDYYRTGLVLDVTVSSEWGPLFKNGHQTVFYAASGLPFGAPNPRTSLGGVSPNYNSDLRDCGPSSASSSSSSAWKAVRIVSKLLCAGYHAITGRWLASDVMISPYKEYLFYRPEIQSHIAKLREDCNRHPCPFSEKHYHSHATYQARRRQQSAELHKFFKAKAELEEWCYLFKIMEGLTEGPRRQMMAYREGSIRKILFRDLWQVFDCGMELVVQSHGVSRGMLLVQVTGGQQILTADANLARRGLHTPGQNHGKGSVYYFTNNKGAIHVHNDYRLTDFADPSSPGERLPQRRTAAKFAAMTSLSLDCIYLWWNGKSLSHAWHRICIPEFEGEVSITGLPAFPVSLEHEPGHGLYARGQKYLALSKGNETVHKMHRGALLGSGGTYHEGPVIIDHLRASEPSVRDHKRTQVDQWVPLLGGDILPLQDPDMREYQISNDPLDPGNYHQLGDYEIDYNMALRALQDPLSDVYKLCNLGGKTDLQVDDSLIKRVLDSTMFAFVLSHRDWARVHVDSIQDIPSSTHGNASQRTAADYGHPDSSILKSLVLPAGHLETLLAVVRHHVRESKSAVDGGNRLVQSMDAVNGKGQGLIVLLYGKSGTGKTSTAEGIAAVTGLPLFPITCNDLGVGPTGVEEALTKHFRMAADWNCILLLDEADVFIARRQGYGDINRDAMIGVFLKVLEYYKGILFLTTNRATLFDEAIISRTRLVLYYPQLSIRDSEQIFKKQIQIIRGRLHQGLEAGGIKSEVMLHVDAASILRFARENHERRSGRKSNLSLWNGRDIKNAFQVVVALVTDRAVEAGDRYAEINGDDFKSIARLKASLDVHIRDEGTGSTEAADSYDFESEQNIEGRATALIKQEIRQKIESVDELIDSLRKTLKDWASASEMS